MTMNKKVRLYFVGVYLPDAFFSHGQLHVALSCVHNSASLAVLPHNSDGYSKNIVYTEVLQ